MAEGPAVPKTHYLKKDQGKKPAEKPWPYRPDTVEKQRELKKKWASGFNPEDPEFESPDYETWKDVYQPLLEFTRKKKDKYEKDFAFSKTTFEDFVKQNDVTLVMFLNRRISAKGDLQDRSSKHFLKAATTTKRHNHAYRVIDCYKNSRLCSEELVKYFPTVRLYTLGRCRGVVKDLNSVTDKVFKGLVENAPLLP